MNTQTQEALHKALKVLNCLNDDRVYETAWVKGAINACEEALAQPAMTYEQGFDHGWEARLAEEQPKQEPVSKTAKRDYNFMRDLAIGTEAILNEMLSAKPIAWTKQSELDKTTTSRNPIAMWKNQYKSIENNVPLYTHPAPSWQGLSDDEIQSILDNSVYCEVDAKPFARAIEQALKEKNEN